MSVFADLGRRALEAQIAATLGIHAGDFDIPAAVEEFVTKWGFQDLGEVPQDEYWELLRGCAKQRAE